MVLKVIKSDNPANKLVSSVAELYGQRGKYCDVYVRVGQTTFGCHKLILALHSTYFEQLLYSADAFPIAIQLITIDDIVPDDFQSVLQYLYTGEVELDNNTVCGILRIAELAHLEHLKTVCVQFMKDTLGVETSVTYWNAAQRLNDYSLGSSCLDIVSKEFVRVTKLSRLEDITRDMMKAVLERDDLNVDSEVYVCEVLMNWLAAQCGSDQSSNPIQILSLIRWSGVDIKYIKSKIITNESLKEDPDSYRYLCRVITYRLSGVQFPGLLTRHRPSTGLESCVVVFGVFDGLIMKRDSCRLSLQNKESVVDNDHVPTHMPPAAAACANISSVYVSGLGAELNETWRWEPIVGWTRCADMIQGRRRHCATFVNNTSMYVLGGWVDSTKTTLSSVERFNTITNKWKTVEQLAQCVHFAGCVTYDESIYLFGGNEEDTNKDVFLDCIQEYDTATQQCTVLTQRLPRPHSVLRAVLCDKSVILMNRITCLIFDMEQKTIQQRDQFAAGVFHFGLVLDNQTLFVLGGATYQTDSNAKNKYKCTDEVKSISVLDIINNQHTVNWAQHAKLNSPSMILSQSLMTLRCT